MINKGKEQDMCDDVPSTLVSNPESQKFIYNCLLLQREWRAGRNAPGLAVGIAFPP